MSLASPKKHLKSQSSYTFENSTTSISAAQMRNALNKLIDGVDDQSVKLKFEKEMDSFFALFRRYITDKASGSSVLDWEKIKSPSVDEVVDFKSILSKEADLTQINTENLNKLAVLKLNGGLGTSMGCVGPKSVIEVRDGQSFLDLSVRQIEHLNRTYDSNVPLLLMNSFNTNADTALIVKKYQGHRIKIKTFNQSRYPRVFKDSLLPVPKSIDDRLDAWYPPGHGDLFESLVASGELDSLLDQELMLKVVL
ncbi:unnamed protein product [[Candida] boidinii]|uniref:Unnamed protein product n=1 Tax=Candida boidinii TaxID=5477 RepID=A0ACB5TSD7_CANBO|nr:unnamed protein product [[Candida] boidinii]